MNRDKLADGVAVANAGFRRFTAIFLVLRRHAARTVRIKGVITADGKPPFQEDMRDQSRARADRNTVADDAVRADFGVGGDCGLRMNDSCGMNRRQIYSAARSVNLHISVASAATWPSTVARPCIFATVCLSRSIFISMRSWSPGTTGLRNLASSTEAKNMILPRVCGASLPTSMPATCAMASMISTPG